jgi:REP element-mobilizing transposase RayT
LHHVIGRGIEWRWLFRDDRDRADFIGRFARVVEPTGLTVLAWALLANHLHRLFRTPTAPSSPPPCDNS